MPAERLTPSAEVYMHVGSGQTPSRYYCADCDGYYGVPHDGDVHSPKHEFSGSCACRPCQERTGRYPNEGVMVNRALAHASIAEATDG